MKPVSTSPASRSILELAAGYAEESVIVTTADLEPPGPEILYVNTAFTKMTGYAAADLIGKTPRILQGPLSDRSQLDRLKAELTAGNDFIARTTNYHRDGSAFELEWVITHLRDDHGRTTHYVAVQRDLTGIERAGAELEAIDAELVELGEKFLATAADLRRAELQMRRAERMNALGRMARGVSHDLANSLMPMEWLLEQLESDDGLSSQSREAIAALRANVEHALSLHRHLAEFAGTADPGELVTVAASELTSGIAALTRSHQSPGGGSCTVTVIADDGLELTVNPVELRQVLINLALNAVDAMTDRGSVTLRLADAGEEVVIEVADDGPGMAPDVAEQCFEPFFTTRTDGTGLGLSICHGIVQAHGGTIDLDTARGRGTTFTIRLPKHNAASADRAGGRPTDLRSGLTQG